MEYRLNNPTSEIGNELTLSVQRRNIISHLLTGLRASLERLRAGTQKFSEKVNVINTTKQQHEEKVAQLAQTKQQAQQQLQMCQGRQDQVRQINEQADRQIQQLTTELQSINKQLSDTELTLLDYRFREDELVNIASCIFDCIFSCEVTAENFHELITVCGEFFSFKTTDEITQNKIFAVCAALVLSVARVLDPRGTVFLSSGNAFVANQMEHHGEALQREIDSSTTINDEVKSLLGFFCALLRKTRTTNSTTAFTTLAKILSQQGFGLLSRYNFKIDTVLEDIVLSYISLFNLYTIKEAISEQPAQEALLGGDTNAKEEYTNKLANFNALVQIVERMYSGSELAPAKFWTASDRVGIAGSVAESMAPSEPQRPPSITSLTPHDFLVAVGEFVNEDLLVPFLRLVCAVGKGRYACLAYDLIASQIYNNLLSWDTFFVFAKTIAERLNNLAIVQYQSLSPVAPDDIERLNAILQLYKVILSGSRESLCLLLRIGGDGDTLRDGLVLFPLTESTFEHRRRTAAHVDYSFTDNFTSTLLSFMFCSPQYQTTKLLALKAISAVSLYNPYIARKCWEYIDSMRLLALENLGISYEFNSEAALGDFQITAAFLKVVHRLLKQNALGLQTNLAECLVRFVKSEVLVQLPRLHFTSVENSLELAEYTFKILRQLIKTSMTASKDFAFSDYYLEKLVAGSTESQQGVLNDFPTKLRAIKLHPVCGIFEEFLRGNTAGLTTVCTVVKTITDLSIFQSTFVDKRVVDKALRSALSLLHCIIAFEERFKPVLDCTDLETQLTIDLKKCEERMTPIILLLNHPLASTKARLAAAQLFARVLQASPVLQSAIVNSPQFPRIHQAITQSIVNFDTLPEPSFDAAQDDADADTLRRAREALRDVTGPSTVEEERAGGTAEGEEEYGARSDEEEKRNGRFFNEELWHSKHQQHSVTSTVVTALCNLLRLHKNNAESPLIRNLFLPSELRNRNGVYVNERDNIPVHVRSKLTDVQQCLTHPVEFEQLYELLYCLSCCKITRDYTVKVLTQETNTGPSGYFREQNEVLTLRLQDAALKLNTLFKSGTRPSAGAEDSDMGDASLAPERLLITTDDAHLNIDLVKEITATREYFNSVTASTAWYLKTFSTVLGTAAESRNVELAQQLTRLILEFTTEFNVFSCTDLLSACFKSVADVLLLPDPEYVSTPFFSSLAQRYEERTLQARTQLYDLYRSSPFCGELMDTFYFLSATPRADTSLTAEVCPSCGKRIRQKGTAVAPEQMSAQSADGDDDPEETGLEQGAKPRPSLFKDILPIIGLCTRTTANPRSFMLFADQLRRLSPAAYCDCNFLCTSEDTLGGLCSLVFSNSVIGASRRGATIVNLDMIDQKKLLLDRMLSVLSDADIANDQDIVHVLRAQFGAVLPGKNVRRFLKMVIEREFMYLLAFSVLRNTASEACMCAAHLSHAITGALTTVFSVPVPGDVSPYAGPCFRLLGKVLDTITASAGSVKLFSSFSLVLARSVVVLAAWLRRNAGNFIAAQNGERGAAFSHNMLLDTFKCAVSTILALKGDGAVVSARVVRSFCYTAFLNLLGVAKVYIERNEEQGEHELNAFFVQNLVDTLQREEAYTSVLSTVTTDATSEANDGWKLISLQTLVLLVNLDVGLLPPLTRKVQAVSMSERAKVLEDNAGSDAVEASGGKDPRKAERASVATRISLLQQNTVKETVSSPFSPGLSAALLSTLMSYRSSAARYCEINRLLKAAFSSVLSLVECGETASAGDARTELSIIRNAFALHTRLVESELSLFYRENTFGTISALTTQADVLNNAARACNHESEKRIKEKARILDGAVLPLFQFVRAYAFAFQSSVQISHDLLVFIKTYYHLFKYILRCSTSVALKVEAIRIITVAFSNKKIVLASIRPKYEKLNELVLSHFTDGCNSRFEDMFSQPETCAASKQYVHLLHALAGYCRAVGDNGLISCIFRPTFSSIASAAHSLAQPSFGTCVQLIRKLCALQADYVKERNRLRKVDELTPRELTPLLLRTGRLFQSDVGTDRFRAFAGSEAYRAASAGLRAPSGVLPLGVWSNEPALPPRSTPQSTEEGAALKRAVGHDLLVQSTIELKAVSNLIEMLLLVLHNQLEALLQGSVTSVSKIDAGMIRPAANKAFGEPRDTNSLFYKLSVAGEHSESSAINSLIEKFKVLLERSDDDDDDEDDSNDDTNNTHPANIGATLFSSTESHLGATQPF